MVEGRPTLSWRLMRWALLALSVPAASQSAQADSPRLGPFEYPRPQTLIATDGEQTFNPSEALNGSIATQEACSQRGRLWIEVAGRSDCIRYYAARLSSGPNPRAIIYFGGDVMLRTSKGVRYITSSYSKQSPATITADLAAWSKMAADVPTFFIARPGIYGSSGDHNERRLPREIDLMDSAVEILRVRYGISQFVLTGHSAGGQIVAALLNRRRDIAAAFISSGMVSVRQVTASWEKRRRLPGRLLYNSDAFYDPVAEVDRIPKNTAPDIYILSDPEDRVVPFYSQLYYVRRLRAMKLNPHHIYLHAHDVQRHVLADLAKLAAALYVHGRKPSDIRRALQDADIAQMAEP